MNKLKFLITVISALIFSTLLLAYSTNLQRQFRDFARNGMIGCFAARYYEASLSVEDIHVRPGDFLDRETMEELGLDPNLRIESGSSSGGLGRIVHVTTVRQRLLMDTITGFVAAARSAGFPISNIHFYLEGSEQSDTTRDLCEILETRFGITARNITRNRFLSHGSNPFSYTLLIGKNGRVLFSTDRMSGCALPTYVNMYRSVSGDDGPIYEP